MKKIILKALILFCCLFAVEVKSQVTHVVISQLFGGGGASSGVPNRDYVELFNPTGSTITMTNWSLQYASAAGTTWTSVTFSGSIAPGKYFLVATQAAQALGTALPTPDASGTAINMSASAGKIALVGNTTALSGSCPTGGAIVDFVGFGTTATCNEGGANTPAPSSTLGLFRSGSGCTDTDVNSTNFSTGTPAPRNSATSPLYCSPSKLVITNITPTNPTAGSGFNVTIVSQDAGSNLNNVIANTAFTLSNTGGGTIGGVTTGTITAGTNSVVVSGVTLSSAATGATITATRNSGDNLAAGTSIPFNVNSAGGTPTKFAITSITPSSPIQNNAFNIVVESQDNSNIGQNVSTTTAFSLTTNGLAGTIGGTTTGSISGGSSSVTITGVTLSGYGTGVTLTASRTSGDNLSDGTSSTFTVIAVASQLTFVGVPSTGVTGSAIPFTVEAKRPDNTTDINYTGNITITKASGPGTLSGTTTVAAVAGIATFSDLVVDLPGSYTLGANSGILTPATSSSISITQSPVTWNFTTTSATGTPSNLTISAISRGNNNGTGGAGGDGTNLLLDNGTPSSGYANFSAGNNGGTAARIGAINTGANGSAYYEFTLTPATGYYVNLTNVSFGSRCTSTGPQAFAIRSSKNSYATDLGTGTLSANSTWALKTTSVSSGNSTPGNAITFRIYGYNGAGSPGANTSNWRIDDLVLTLDVQQCNVTASATGTNVSCFGGNNGTATVSASGGTGFTYSWSPSGGTAATATGLSAGTYTCLITSSVGCTATSTVAINQPSAPLSASISNTDVSCNGGANGSATVTATGGTPTYTYSWAPSGGTASTATGLGSGTYTCTITDANNCTTTQTVTISQPSTALSASASKTDVSCNGGSNGSATVTATGGTPTYTYSWSPAGGTSSSATGLASGTYTCIITDANGCSTTQTVSIAQPTALSISISASPTSICAGNTSTLTANSTGGTGSTIYSWNTAESTNSISVSPSISTTYTVTGVDDNGCTNIATQLVTVNALPSVAASASPSSVCSGSTATLTATGALSYNWNTGNSTSVITVSPSSNTTYTVTGADANGCVSTATVAITTITCAGTAAEALYFDGVDDKVTGTNANLPQGITARTITAWIKPNRVTGASQTIYSYGSQTNGGTCALLIDGTTGNLYFSGQNNDFNGGTACAITPNVWTHVGLTLTDKTVRLYINGVLKSSGTLATSPASSGTNWAISNTAWSANTREPFDGVIDEVTVWNKVVNTTEMNSTYNSELPSTQAGLVALYHFNQGFDAGQNSTTTSLTDAINTSNNGALNGFTLNGSTSNWVAPGKAGKTKMLATYCGTTLTNLSGSIACEMVGNATDYQWQFTDQSNSTVVTCNRGVNYTNFFFSQCGQIAYGKTYSVKVRAYANGAWGTFGDACLLTTPAMPTTSITSPTCGTTMAAWNTALYCPPVTNATDYQWELVNVNTSQVYTKLRGNNYSNFYIYMIQGLSPNTQYSIRARAIVGGVPGTYGNACLITTPSGPEPLAKILNPDAMAQMEPAIESTELQLNLYPNPSNGLFNIESSSTENIQVEVYDAIGKLVIKQDLTSTIQLFDITEKESGLYFIRITQNNKTVYSNRIIKQ